MQKSQGTILHSLIRGILFAAIFCLLFTGIGSCENLGTYFIYQNVSDYNIDKGIWCSDKSQICVRDGGIYPQGEFTPGTYWNVDDSMTVLNPDASYHVDAAYMGKSYPVENGGRLYMGSTFSFTVESLASMGVTVQKICVTKPSGNFVITHLSEINSAIEEIGTYEIRAFFEEGDFVEGGTNVASSTFTVKVVDNNPLISSPVDSVCNGDIVSFYVTGAPGDVLTLNIIGFEIPENQVCAPEPTNTNNQYTLTLPLNGETAFTAKVNTNQNIASVELVGVGDDNIVNIDVVHLEMTAEVKKETYILGDEILIFGTSPTADKTYAFSITGYNFDETDLTQYFKNYNRGNYWKASFSTDDVVSTNGKKLGAGTYTISVKDGDDVLVSVAVNIYLPFISITSIPDTVAQENTLVVTGIAEAAETIQYYLFGTDFFKSGVVSQVTTQDGNTFWLSIPIENTQPLGTYCLIIQHPMYDKIFNIYPDGTDIMLRLDSSTSETFLFDVYESNSDVVQKICEEFDNQNIDDQYIKAIFTVLPPTEDIISDAKLPLTPGWNFISVPNYLDASCDTAGELFASLDTAGMSILGYDAKTGWHTLKAETPIKPLDGYWVYSKTAKTLSLAYSADINVPPTKTVYKGWNAVGLSAETSMTAKSAFSNLNWVRCIPWDVEKGKWGTVIVKGGSTENSEELKLKLGNGNWLYVESDGTYIGNTA